MCVCDRLECRVMKKSPGFNLPVDVFSFGPFDGDDGTDVCPCVSVNFF